MNQTPDGINTADVRAWAVTNGYPHLAGKNGRLPAAAITGYLNAQAPSESA